MSQLEEMTVDDLNMYYSGTHLSVQGSDQVYPFHIDHFESEDSKIFARGSMIKKLRGGNFNRVSSVFPVSDLRIEIPEVGYVLTEHGEHWIETTPPSRGYKKGYNVERIDAPLGRQGVWGIFNETYRDFIVTSSAKVVYKGIAVGKVESNTFTPSHEDFEYLEDYINETINRSAL